MVRDIDENSNHAGDAIAVRGDGDQMSSDTWNYEMIYVVYVICVCVEWYICGCIFRDESDEARSRNYHKTFKEKNKQVCPIFSWLYFGTSSLLTGTKLWEDIKYTAQVSLNDDQKELYGVQEGFEVAQFDPER